MATCTHWVYPSPKKSRIPYYEMIMCAYSRSNGDIEIRIEHKDNINAPDPEIRFNWEMKLWRFYPSAPGSPVGTWKLGGTRTGYVSDISPSRRIFTNCKPGWWYVWVKYTDDYDITPGQQTILFKHGVVNDPKPDTRLCRPSW